MRILDTKSDKALKSIILYLTYEEIKEIYDDLERIITIRDKNYHTHINDLSFDHQVTLVAYEENDVEHFNERSKILIKEDR